MITSSNLLPLLGARSSSKVSYRSKAGSVLTERLFIHEALRLEVLFTRTKSRSLPMSKGAQPQRFTTMSELL